MKNFLTILSICLTLQFGVSCTGIRDESNSAVNGNAAVNTNQKGKSANDSAEELALLFVLAFEPTEVAWREETVPDTQNKQRLKAAIRFEPADADKVAEQAGQAQPPVDVEIESEEWFPPELVAQSEMNEGSKLKGKEYPADSMLQQPFTKGRLVRIENTDYFVLEAFKQ